METLFKHTSSSPSLLVPQSPSQKIDTLLCQSCHRILLSTKFNLPAGSHQISRCRRCTALDSVARTRKDVCSYKNMLLRLRVEEQQLNKEARITFLLQVISLVWPFSLSQHLHQNSSVCRWRMFSTWWRMSGNSAQPLKTAATWMVWTLFAGTVEETGVHGTASCCPQRKRQVTWR